MAVSALADVPPPPPEGKTTPKLCLEMGAGGLSAGAIDDAGCRRIKQLGIDHVLSSGVPMPWDEGRLKTLMERLAAGGLTLGNLMIGGFPNTIYGKPGRDEEIEKVKQSIRAAGMRHYPLAAFAWTGAAATTGTIV